MGIKFKLKDLEKTISGKEFELFNRRQLLAYSDSESVIYTYDFRILIPDIGASIRLGTWCLYDESGKEEEQSTIIVFYKPDEIDISKFEGWSASSLPIYISNNFPKFDCMEKVENIDCEIVFD